MGRFPQEATCNFSEAHERWQNWQRNDARGHASDHEVSERIDSKRFESVDLLCDAQDGELGSDGRAHTSGNEEARHQRPDLTEHRARQLGGNEQIYSAKIYERCPD